MSRLNTFGRVFLMHIVVLICLFVASRSVKADGLIYQLPKDGSWVRYEVVLHHWDYTPLHSPQEDLGDERRTRPREDYDRGVMVVQSVGKVTVDGEACRWIELKAEPPPTNKRAVNAAQVYKMLIPERDLKEGGDPFRNVRKMYYQPGAGVLTIDMADKDMVKYQLDRIRRYFPSAPTQMTREKLYVLETPNGRITGELLTFTFRFEGKLSAGKYGFYSNTCRYRVVLDPNAPFGVNYFEVEGESVEKYADLRVNQPLAHRGWKSRFREDFLMKESGKGATSALPDKN